MLFILFGLLFLILGVAFESKSRQSLRKARQYDSISSKTKANLWFKKVETDRAASSIMVTVSSPFLVAGAFTTLFPQSEISLLWIAVFVILFLSVMALVCSAMFTLNGRRNDRDLAMQPKRSF